MRTTTKTPEEILSKLREYRAKYYKEKYTTDEEFKNKLKTTAKKYYEENKERIKNEKKIKYREKHPKPEEETEIEEN